MDGVIPMRPKRPWPWRQVQVWEDARGFAVDIMKEDSASLAGHSLTREDAEALARRLARELHCGIAR